jgi:hypothetical protein
LTVDSAPTFEAPRDAASWFTQVRDSLRAGRLAPYLGPGLTELGRAPVPTTQRALAEFLGSRVSLPKRARGNLGAAAQYIESHKHRSVVVKLMAEAFVSPVDPLPFHRWLAGLPAPLIVDTWYDGAMRAALAGRSDWGEIQGVRRSGLGEDHYYAAYDALGNPCAHDAARGWTTLLYKPHGATVPAYNFLVSDSDYVEVLTEIDIQTPIPKEVQSRRTDVGFLFLGCRLNDQTLRSYARQLVKRSGGPHYIVVEPRVPTRMEQRFINEHRLIVLVSPLSDALAELTRP